MKSVTFPTKIAKKYKETWKDYQKNVRVALKKANLTFEQPLVRKIMVKLSSSKCYVSVFVPLTDKIKISSLNKKKWGKNDDGQFEYLPLDSAPLDLVVLKKKVYAIFYISVSNWSLHIKEYHGRTNPSKVREIFYNILKKWPPIKEKKVKVKPPKMLKGDLLFAKKRCTFKDLKGPKYYLIQKVYQERKTKRWVYDFYMSNRKKKKGKKVSFNYADVLDYWIGTTKFNLLKVVKPNRPVTNF